jgi:sugar phosphate isomerase/epimerase
MGHFQTRSRREFLTTGAAALAAAGRLPATLFGQEKSLTHPLKGTVGIQLYSFRHDLDKDVPGTLAKVRAFGFRDVETYSLHKMKATEFADLLQRHGLKASSAHMPYERCRDNLPGVIVDAKALGVEYVTVAWIPHKTFDRDVTLAAAKHFSAWGAELRKHDLRFAYHLHGYEFHKSLEGTLLDTLLANTPEDAVFYEMDVFWVVHPGGDPTALLRKYPGRFRLMHLKDMAKGTKSDLTGHAPDDSNGPLGTGTVDWPPILRAAEAAGVKYYYLEDENVNVMKQVPQSLQYLAGLKL